MIIRVLCTIFNYSLSLYFFLVNINWKKIASSVLVKLTSVVNSTIVWENLYCSTYFFTLYFKYLNYTNFMKHFIKHLVSRFTRVCTKNHLHLMKGKLSESFLLVKSTPRSKNFSFQLFVCEEFFFSSFSLLWRVSPPRDAGNGICVSFRLASFHSHHLSLSFTLCLSLSHSLSHSLSIFFIYL